MGTQKILNVGSASITEQKGEVNWSHVGSLGHVEELLQEIVELLG